MPMITSHSSSHRGSVQYQHYEVRSFVLSRQETVFNSNTRARTPYQVWWVKINIYHFYVLLASFLSDACLFNTDGFLWDFGFIYLSFDTKCHLTEAPKQLRNMQMKCYHELTEWAKTVKKNGVHLHRVACWALVWTGSVTGQWTRHKNRQ